jgi:two-component system, NtrC family, sensor kinase
VKEPTDINALAEEYLRLSYHGLRAKDKEFNATMETHFETPLSKVEVIPQDMGRVFLNLINNAFYAVSQKAKSLRLLSAEQTGNNQESYQPTVTVSTRYLAPPLGLKGAGCVEIRIKDNGIGMPDSVKAKVFQPFFTTKPTGQGTGLGLSISYDIVTKGHGGTLEVNTKEGEYTEFIIKLP